MKRILLTLRRSRHVTVLSIIGLLVGTGAIFGWFSFANEASSLRSVNLVIDNSPIQRTGSIPRSFSDVVKEVAPSVVRVNTTSKVKARQYRPSSPGMNPWFDRFFENGQNNQRDRLPLKHGLGSGVIVSEDGYILTNNHVIEGADEIQVVLNESDRAHQAELVGRDPKSDLAVLKIKANGLPYTRIGDSDQIEVGDLVLAIGNPFGVGQTVTMGIVGATGRASMGLDYEDFIQTDAAINPGNSGGALVDVEGRLIGINTAILSKTGSNQGIGFAIPTNLARNVMEDLIEKGHVTRGFLGVMIQDVSPKLADYFEISDSEGALIADVTPRSPAAEAGLKTGDVILRFNDTEIEGSRHLKLLIGASDPNTTHEFSILREGERQIVEVELEELNDGKHQLAQRSNQSDSDGGLDGVTVADIDTQFRSQYQLSRRVQGAVVTNVDQTSPAWRAGLRPGDVIREINRTPINNADEAVEKSETLKKEVVLLRIWRQGSTLFLAVDESKIG